MRQNQFSTPLQICFLAAVNTLPCHGKLAFPPRQTHFPATAKRFSLATAKNQAGILHHHCKEACLPGVFSFFACFVQAQRLLPNLFLFYNSFSLLSTGRRRILVLHLHDLRLLRRIRRIPSSGGHFLVNLVLHGNAAV